MIYIYIYIYTCTCVCVNIYLYMHTCLYIYEYTYIHTPTYTTLIYSASSLSITPLTGSHFPFITAQHHIMSAKVPYNSAHEPYIFTKQQNIHKRTKMGFQHCSTPRHVHKRALYCCTRALHFHTKAKCPQKNQNNAYEPSTHANINIGTHTQFTHRRQSTEKEKIISYMITY